MDSDKNLLSRMRKYCVYQERCHQEIRTKLKTLKVNPAEIENIIARLIEENFINEERFAIAFAGGKFRTKNWGKEKIIYELKRRNISEYCIKKALNVISAEEYQLVLKKIIEKKIKSKIFSSHEESKLVYFLIKKGYGVEEAWCAVRNYFN